MEIRKEVMKEILKEIKLLPSKIATESDKIAHESGQHLIDLEISTETSPSVYGSDLRSQDQFFIGGSEKILFDSLWENYDLGEVLDVERPSVMSTTSRKVVIHTNRGSFFLKEKPEYSTGSESLELTADFQIYLSDKVDFVPRIVGTIEGDSYITVGTRVFLITEYVSGRYFSGTTSDVMEAARGLAKIHNHSARFNSGASHRFRDSENEALFFIDMANNLPGSEEDPHKKTTMSLLTDIVKKSKRKTQNLIQIIGHGDFSPFNMVYLDNSLVAVNDFDNASLYDRIRDVSEAMLTFGDGINYAGNTSSFKRPVLIRANEDKIGAFLRTYSMNLENPLSQQEREAIIWQSKLLWVELMCLGLVRGDFSYVDVYNSLSFINFIEEKMPGVI